MNQTPNNNRAPLNPLEAALAGWRVVRLGRAELTLPVVGRLVALIDGAAPPAA